MILNILKDIKNNKEETENLFNTFSFLLNKNFCYNGTDHKTFYYYWTEKKELNNNNMICLNDFKILNKKEIKIFLFLLEFIKEEKQIEISKTGWNFKTKNFNILVFDYNNFWMISYNIWNYKILSKNEKKDKKQYSKAFFVDKKNFNEKKQIIILLSFALKNNKNWQYDNLITMLFSNITKNVSNQIFTYI